MIRLKKRALTQELTERIAQRTQRYLQLTAEGEKVPDSLLSAYKDPDVKTLLREETSGKCAYCESKVPHVDYGDVEHIVSKAVRPELRYAYSNLTYACGVCNTKKGDYHNEGTPLLNPYVDEPADHLIAVGPMVLRRPVSDRGLLTQRRLDLNRAALVERRQERLEAIATLFDQVARTADVAIREVLIEQCLQECSGDKEYSFVARTYVEQTQQLLA